jgi:hypothetical protein
MNYLVAEVDAGAKWVYQPPVSHDIAWAYVFEGKPKVQDQPSHEELLVFDGAGSIQLESTAGPSRTLIGSGERHRHPLVLGPSSVHTNEVSLARGQQRIEALGIELRQSGRLR